MIGIKNIWYLLNFHVLEAYSVASNGGEKTETDLAFKDEVY